MPQNEELWKVVEGQFPMGRLSHHGPKHWRRVLLFGQRLAETVPRVDLEVLELFAVFHDSRRVNDAVDDGHGERGAELALALHGKHFQLSPERLDLLVSACKGHTAGQKTEQPTIAVCWDSDRLDLWRVGIYPSADCMCTDEAKKKAVIEWAVNYSALA
jgi:uncharacterized protein